MSVAKVDLAAQIREDFPALSQTVYGRPLVYLDNAATTQKPRAVIEAMNRFYLTDCANIHRGVHLLSERATAAYEQARVTVQRFLNAAQAREIVFVRGATEAINLVAQTYGAQNLHPSDEVLITGLEHHSNIVPWQMLCQENGALCGWRPSTTGARSGSGVREAAGAAHQVGVSGPCLERIGYRQPGS